MRLFERGDIDGENFPRKLAEVGGVVGVVMPVAALKLCIKLSMISCAPKSINTTTLSP